MLRISETPQSRSLKFPTLERGGGPLGRSTNRVEGSSILTVPTSQHEEPPTHALKE